MKQDELPHATKVVDPNSLKIAQVKCGYNGSVIAIEIEDSQGRKAVYVPFAAYEEVAND